MSMSTENYTTVGAAARMVGRCADTLRLWDRTGPSRLGLAPGSESTRQKTSIDCVRSRRRNSAEDRRRTAGRYGDPGVSSIRLAGAEEMILDFEFRKAIAKSGITPPEVIQSDGKLHRFATNGKATDLAGWYIFYPDGIPAGAYGCWRSGLSRTWRANIGRTLTPAEEAACQAKMDAARRVREREEARRHAEAREEAVTIWKASKPAPSDHPYLVKKGVKPHGAPGARRCSHHPDP